MVKTPYIFDQFFDLNPPENTKTRKLANEPVSSYEKKLALCNFNKEPNNWFLI